MNGMVYHGIRNFERAIPQCKMPHQAFYTFEIYAISNRILNSCNNVINDNIALSSISYYITHLSHE